MFNSTARMVGEIRLIFKNVRMQRHAMLGNSSLSRSFSRSHESIQASSSLLLAPSHLIWLRRVQTASSTSRSGALIDPFPLSTWPLSRQDTRISLCPVVSRSELLNQRGSIPSESGFCSSWSGSTAQSCAPYLPILQFPKIALVVPFVPQGQQIATNDVRC